jgi:hypothetical protein
MKTIKIFFVLSALIMTSCAKDACKDTVCNNGGVCNDGTCICAAWFEGTNCSTEQRAKYFGVYDGEYEFYDADGVVWLTGAASNTVTTGSNVNYLNFNELDENVPLSTSGSGNFNHTYQTEILGQVFDYNIVGSFNGNLLEFNTYNPNDGVLLSKFTGFK